MEKMGKHAKTKNKTKKQGTSQKKNAIDEQRNSQNIHKSCKAMVLSAQG